MDEYQAASESISSPKQDILQCSLCAFAASNRSELKKHLISHCASKQYNNSDYNTVLGYLSVLKSTSNPNSDSCSSFVLTEPEIEESDASSLNASRIIRNVNKRKTSFQETKKCKHCNFIANTKIEYWEHMRNHIEKGFSCTKCSFVTKYKHHMTHHWLSIHDGSKPFKCKKCSYMCVSKSMLSSHLKKHSNIYSYRCASCEYKSKFCNALKRHLRKKGHQPAMVLNADGTPNPLSIIDVYGTKRGPKQKTPSKKQEEPTTAIMMTTTNNQLDSTVTSPSLPFHNSIIHYSNMTTINGINDGHWINQNDTIKNEPNAMFPYNDLVAAFNLSSQVSFCEDKIFHEKYTENMQKANNVQLTDPLTEYAKILCTEDWSSKIFLKNLPVTHLDMTNNVNKRTESTDVPLDLSKTEQNINNNKLQFHSLIKNTTNSSKDIRTNKRKGKAIKLEHYIMEEDTDEQEQNKDAFSDFLPDSTIDFYEINERAKEIESENNLFDAKLICHYCEIVFGNVVMYTMHMSCHNLTHPYTCNMCGKQCNDKLSFSLHIVQTEH
ncbi:hypothetical protein PUN28_016139 [Cardiocondyla obscurior]|uniref:C2H2-type domain-containing protein n=1 Tax=Cardiocondyla obscurior TaxID=286306 RepID=A0AAW2EW38_9HYME